MPRGAEVGREGRQNGQQTEGHGHTASLSDIEVEDLVLQVPNSTMVAGVPSYIFQQSILTLI